jgi:hypothetical protein
MPVNPTTLTTTSITPLPTTAAPLPDYFDHSLEAIDGGWASKAEFDAACKLYAAIKREMQPLPEAAAASPLPAA